MMDESKDKPWLSFCISTFKRPAFLQQQIKALLEQEDPRFEIVISDNDPEGSGETIASSFGDERVRYFRNETNLGMVKSFNNSIDRARTPFITMVTDDDPIDRSFSAEMRSLREQFPGHSLYGGFSRVNKGEREIDKIDNKDFLEELLDPQKTSAILWSSCILDRNDAIQAGKMPDFGSPHLADHAMLVLTGSRRGGVIMNAMFSRLNVHETNFSKLNFSTYVQGCKGFYEIMEQYIAGSEKPQVNESAVKKHLAFWFIPCIFNLKRYYTVKGDKDKLAQVDDCAKQILSFQFMKNLRPKFFYKELALRIKKTIGILKS